MMNFKLTISSEEKSMKRWKCKQAAAILEKAHTCKEPLTFKGENEAIFHAIFLNPFNQSLSGNLLFDH